MAKFLFILQISLLGCAMTMSLASLADAGEKKSSREKAIDFEDEVVEGMNKRPLDSLNTLSEKDRKKNKPHLYRKRGGFKIENMASVREMRLSP